MARNAPKSRMRGAPELGGGQPLAKKQRGKPERAGRTKELQRLGKRDPHLPDRDVIQDMRQADAGHGGNDQDDVHVEPRPAAASDFPERQGERQKQRRRDEADHPKAADRAEPRGRPFHQDTVKGPAKTGGESDGEYLQRDGARLLGQVETKERRRRRSSRAASRPGIAIGE